MWRFLSSEHPAEGSRRERLLSEKRHPAANDDTPFPAEAGPPGLEFA